MSINIVTIANAEADARMAVMIVWFIARAPTDRSRSSRWSNP
jgi:hypothetical protein